MKIALIGSEGQFGTAVMEVFPKEWLVPLTHKDIEITDKANIAEVLDEIKPDIVLNTAAYIKSDEAEDKPEIAFVINAIGAKNLAQYCKDINSILVHISTDYVFDGKKTTPYIETDHTRPINAYGIAKLAGEHFIQYINPKYYIIRSSGFGLFVDLMLKLAKEGNQIKVVADQTMSPVYTKDLAEQILKLIQTDKYGIYHATGIGVCTWYEFAEEIFRLTNQSVDMIGITSDQFGAKAQRPKYSVLSNDKLKSLGIYCMRHWKEGLIDYLKAKKED